MKKPLSKIRYLILSLICFFLIVSGNLTYKAISHYQDYTKKIVSWNNLFNENKIQYESLNWKYFLIFLDHVAKFEIQKIISGGYQEHSELDTFHLKIKKKKLAELNSNLPFSGKEYVSAKMKYKNIPGKFKVKVKYRGDMPNHWMYEKKSIRVKMKKVANLPISRKFNLISLDTYKTTVDLVTYKLAKEEGLIAPNFYPVRVFINKDYYGVYFYLDQTKEQLLRDFNRMPGSIYQETGFDYQENEQNSEIYNNVDEKGVGKLWIDEVNWEKIASRNAEQEENREDIQFITNAVAKYTDLEFYDFANRYLNKRAYYNYFGIDVLTGSPHHTFIHNHKLYFDPYKGQYEPIEWDVRYWSDKPRHKDLSNYQLLERISLNPVLEAERDKVAYQLVQKYTPEILFDRYQQETKTFINDLSNDKLRRAFNEVFIHGQGYHAAFPISDFEKFIKDQKKILSKRSKFLNKLFNEVEARYQVQENKIVFEVGGNNPVIIDKDYLLASLGISKLYPDRNLDNKFNEDLSLGKNKIILYPGRVIKRGNVFDWHSIAVLKLYGNRHTEPHPEYYSFFFREKDIQSPSELKVRNLITNKEVTISNLPFKKIETDSQSIHSWLLPKKVRKKVVFSGIVSLEGLNEYDEFTTIVIKPGTQFSMGARASLVSYGKLLAEGTKDKPISFVAKNPQEPWGALVVQGEGASGSKFKYVNFKDGSLLVNNLIDYTAPFNIHDLDQFEVANCLIGQNHIGDDAMHIAYSKGVVKDSKFINARSDALDVDISEVNLINNQFYNSGNDAIDSMTSNLTIASNIISGAGDKCVSVGERSTGMYVDNVFDNCEIGIEVKDESNITVKESTISKSRKFAINIYRKNYLYNDAGKIYDHGIIIKDNSIINKNGFKHSYVKVSDE